jgi:hypothetical protein
VQNLLRYLGDELPQYIKERDEYGYRYALQKFQQQKIQQQQFSGRTFTKVDEQIFLENMIEEGRREYDSAKVKRIQEHESDKAHEREVYAESQGWARPRRFGAPPNFSTDSCASTKVSFCWTKTTRKPSTKGI